MFTHHNQRGISIIELIMFMVVVSIGVVAIMQTTSFTTQHSADTMLRKQALAAAEGILEQFEQSEATTLAANSSVPTQAVPNLTGYTYSANAVMGTSGVWSYIPAASTALITVTVTDPTGQITTLNGYQINY